MRRKPFIGKTVTIIGLSALAATLAGCPKGGKGGKGASASRAEQSQTVSEKVKVEFFVMSHCPFGTQVENGIAPVLDKMGGDIDFSLNFIGQMKDGKLSSMHGPDEVKGDEVQLCAAKYSPAQYMDMIVCMNKNARAIPGNWEGCAKDAGVDVAKVKACYEGPEGENLLKASFEEAQKRRARGSPTMFINGKPYRGPRSEKAFTRAICNAFPKDKPALCKDIPPPVKVPVTIITDKRCKECRAQFWERRLKNMFPGAQVTIVDYTDDAGKKLYEKVGVKLLPAILFDKEVEKADNYQRIRRFLSPKGDYLQFRSGAKFDPSKEVCDNGKDDTGNGLVDCKDPDCKHAKVCMEKCDNGKDDTGNGLVDCKDPDCKNTLICRKEIPKKLEVFVMSQCPYGVRALNAMKEVLDNFKNDIHFEVHYIASALPDGKFRSLHGQGEVDEDMRELCAMKHYAKNYKWMDYVLCRNKDIRKGSWESCTGENGISADVIKKCVESDGKKLLTQDIKIAEGLGIGASPTWLANNKFKFSGIDAETVRRNICQHNKGMKNCDKKLSGPAPRKAGGGGSCK